jgi:murein L,D-transpeptidase YcbB/YkuD
VKSVRFDRLLASTALGLVLVLSSHPGGLRQALAQSDAQPAATVPTPDTTLPPPLTAKDVAAPTAQATPAAPPAATIDTPPPAAAVEAPKPAVVVAPAPVAPTTVADSAVSDRLREMAGKLDRSMSRKADRDGVEAYYKARNYAPIWVSNGAANDRAKSAIAYLAQADAVGLEPADYPAPDFKSAATVDALADAELKLTAAALTFARQAQIGRVHFTRVSADMQFDLKAPEPADVLAKLADGGDAGKVLDSYNPPMPEFKALREKLAELRKNGGVIAKTDVKTAPPHVMVPEGKILRPGMKDERVVALRKRLDIAPGRARLPEERRHERRRQSRHQYRQGDERREERDRPRAIGQSDRHHPSEYGALALVCARPWQSARRRQHSGLYADAHQ